MAVEAVISDATLRRFHYTTAATIIWSLTIVLATHSIEAGPA
jgi:hypothetical protein